jgi:hypothetical protein
VRKVHADQHLQALEVDAPGEEQAVERHGTPVRLRLDAVERHRVGPATAHDDSPNKFSGRNAHRRTM